MKFITSNRIIGLSIFVFALLIRLLFIWQTHDIPDFRSTTPGLDMCVHWEGAKHIRAGTDNPIELMLPSAPFHPYFVATCQSLLGENLLTHRIARAFLGSLSVLLIFLISLQLSKNRYTALFAAFTVLTLPSWIYFDTMLIKASIEILMLCTGLWIILKIPNNWPRNRLLITGLMLGILFSLLRFSQGATLLYAAMLSIYIYMDKATTRSKRLCIILPMLTLLFASQMTFKYREAIFDKPARSFLPVGGVHFRIGFQPGAIGTYHPWHRFASLPLGHTFFSRMSAEALAGKELTAIEANKSYEKETLDFIRANKKETASIVLRKLGLFFNNFEPAGNHYLYDINKKSSALRIPSVKYGGLFILAMLGVFALFKKRQYRLLFLLCGLIIAEMVPNILGFVTWRYRIHVTIPFAILSAFGIAYASNRIQHIFKSDKVIRLRILKEDLILPLAICSVSAFVAFRPVPAIVQKSMFETAKTNLALSSRSEILRKDIQALVKEKPLSATQQIRLATMLHRAGRYTDAFNITETLTAETSNELYANRQYVVYLMWQGRYNDTVKFMSKLLEQDKRSFVMLLRSFESEAFFWDEKDRNMKLLVQALIRDIVLPKLDTKVFGSTKDN